MKNILLLLLITVLSLTEGVAAEIFHPVDASLYPENMTMVIRLTDGGAMVDTCEVAAFVGGECRGAARATDGLYYLLIVGRGGGQPMELRTCLNNAIVTIDNTLQYVSDRIIGTPKAPYIIDLQHLNTGGIKGDVNGDGIVNIADVAAIIQQLMANSPQPEADVNGDGKVDVADILATIRSSSWTQN